MISVVITAYKEEKTIGRAIEAILKNKLKNFEILVLAPDNATLEAARKYKKVRAIRDKGEGKPAALNLAYKSSRGQILIFTDGDVYADNNSLAPLISFLEDKRVGAVSGNPVSLDSRRNKLGFWAYLLTKIASETRITAIKKNNRFFCSGYLFAIRKKLFPKIPAKLLSEDGYISLKVYSAGYKLAYSENSKVYVKYPTNFSDWIKQKKRSAGGYSQIREMTGENLRSFGSESLGAFSFFKYISSPKELVWLFQLFLARVYLWFAIYRDITVKKKSSREIWQRVESTK